MIRNVARRLLTLIILLVCMFSLLFCITCGALRSRDHGSGETFLFYLTRNTPSYRMAGLQTWSSGGAVRFAYSRFERDVPDDSLPPKNPAGKMPPFFQFAEYSPGAQPVPLAQNSIPDADSVHESGAFQWFRRDYRTPGYTELQYSICAPAWFYLATTSVIPGTCLFIVARRLQRKIIARHRRKRGRCAACGYDLRESPDCCPECGTTPTGAAIPTST